MSLQVSKLAYTLVTATNHGCLNFGAATFQKLSIATVVTDPLPPLPFLSFSSPSLRIDHWDFERERMLLLSDNNLISVRYNFIHSAVEELKYIPLSCIVNLVYGDFKYTSSFI